MNGATGDERPVVMTVPMEWDSPNHVVGESLQEFLALGSARGYFALEQIAYDLGQACEEIESTRRERDSERVAVLRLLRQRFGLRRWRGVRERLLSLRKRYGSAIQVR